MTSTHKNLRVGGDFELSLNTILPRESSDDYVSFIAPYSLKLDTGRSALYLVANAIKQMGGTERVWLPAYGCESISNAFLLAGYDINYYTVAADLLQEVLPIEKTMSGDTVLFIHYFGHLNKKMLKEVSAYNKKGVWTIEDFVQAGLTKTPTLTGDFAITSYRKLLNVPDGAILASRFPIESLNEVDGLAQADESFISAKLVAKMLRANNEDAEIFLPIMEQAEQSLLGSIVPRHISWFSDWMISHLDLQDIADKRRKNWGLLSSALENSKLDKLVRPLFLVLEDIEVPLGFPVLVTDGSRDALRHYLAEREIFCPIHWDMDFLPNKDQFPSEMQMSSSLLTLPIDQRMTSEHIDYMMNSIMSFFRESK